MKENLVSIYSRYKQLIWPTTVGLVGIVIVALVIYPQVKAYIVSQKNIREAQSRLENLNVKAAELDSLDGQVIKQDLQVAQGALPEDQEPSVAFQALQQIAFLSGVSIASLEYNIGHGGNVSGTSSFIINAQVLSNKTNLGAFLKNISQSSLVMLVSGLNVSSSSNNDVLIADMQINVFYSPSPNRIGAIDAPLPQLSSAEQNLIGNLAKSPISIPTSTINTSEATTVVPRGKANPFE